MKTYIAKLKSTSPYSQGRHYTAEKLDKESPEAYESRTWRGRMHVANGKVFIPPTAIKNCLSDAARFLSMGIKGKGKATYTKHIEAGVMVCDPVEIGVDADSVPGEELFVPSDGKRGGGKRVNRIFPLIAAWQGEAKIHVLDETVTKDVLLRHLQEAGNLIGVGRFRPRNNGYYGRFKVEELVECNE